MANCIQTNKLLIDEHQALQTLYNSHERKLREHQTENDQLVGTLNNDNYFTCGRFFFVRAWKGGGQLTFAFDLSLVLMWCFKTTGML